MLVAVGRKPPSHEARLSEATDEKLGLSTTVRDPNVARGW
jgi:hypothetical protein